MDPMTIIAIAEKLLPISLSAFQAFRRASAEAGAGDEVLAELDAKYEARIQHEKDIQEGRG